jgi:hypothetical protein
VVALEEEGAATAVGDPVGNATDGGTALARLAAGSSDDAAAAASEARLADAVCLLEMSIFVAPLSSKLLESTVCQRTVDGRCCRY